jgi:hypothetical protein
LRVDGERSLNFLKSQVFKLKEETRSFISQSHESFSSINYDTLEKEEVGIKRSINHKRSLFLYILLHSLVEKNGRESRAKEKILLIFLLENSVLS